MRICFLTFSCKLEKKGLQRCRTSNAEQGNVEKFSVLIPEGVEVQGRKAKEKAEEQKKWEEGTEVSSGEEKVLLRLCL
ncbi:hypothetical protein TNCV_2859871 [Trichonephila clavipes]|nr:hypothetical protein TNCV_2859871 [Trichonephila clavipes]